MPCYDHYFGVFAGKTIMNDEAHAYMDKLARLLCEANRLIDDRDALGYETHTSRSKELEQWWKEHQEFDRKRKKR